MMASLLLLPRRVLIAGGCCARRSLAHRWFSVSGSGSAGGNTTNNRPSILVSAQQEEPTDAAAADAPLAALRLSKLIAQQRGTSRRKAERMIRAGKVVVGRQGVVVTASAAIVAPEDLDSITVDGKWLGVPGRVTKGDKAAQPQKFKTRVWLVHKLAGELVTENDPKGRNSVLERVVRGGVGKSKKGGKHEHIKAIGRLDMNTTGLLLVTNDGDYARQMELPTTQLHRKYRARVHGRIAAYKLNAMRKSLRIEGVKYNPMKVQLMETRKKTEATNQWLEVTCTEGKNRQVRKVLQHFGCKFAFSLLCMMVIRLR